MPPADSVTRKSVSLPDELWKQIEDFRFYRRFPTEAGAIRALLERGIISWQDPVEAAYAHFANLSDELFKLLSALPLERQTAVADLLASAKAGLAALEPLYNESISLAARRGS